jgi:anti-sigma B factor antagonist
VPWPGVLLRQNLVTSRRVKTTALLPKQEGLLMFSTDLSSRGGDGHALVALRGELDLVDAASVAFALAMIADRDPVIVADLAGLEFIDSSGVVALARGRRRARQAGGDLVLAAPRQRVTRVLAAIRLTDPLIIYASADEALTHEPAGPDHRHTATATR